MQQQEIYLAKQGRHFWHCQLLSLKPVTLQIRSGELNTTWERPHTVDIQMHKYQNPQAAVEAMSNLIQQQLRLGFHEIRPDEIVKAYQQHPDEEDVQFEQELKQFIAGRLQPKSKPPTSKKEQLKLKLQKKLEIKEPAFNLPAKPIVALTDDATNGKLIGEWPRYRSRSHLGETLDLGPPGGGPAFPLLLAHNYEQSIDPTGYYLSEKLDGMRVLWSGCEMFTRNGNSLNFPTSFVEGWPTTYLDGELWMDRGKFQKLLSVARKKTPDNKAWTDIKFMVFDAPMLDLPFSQRYAKLKKAIEKIKNQHLVYVPHILCQGRDHLNRELRIAQAAGAEGLMLRDPDSFYEGKRSKDLLKVKTAMDAEATIIGLVDGLGKFEGQLGALQVQNDQGVEFSVGVGMKLNMRKKPPELGTRITYRYYGLTDDGKPRFPVFERLHSDL